jgi:hypothetical protein
MQNRRLSLPRFEPWTCHQKPQLRHDMSAALMPERERSVTPLAMPVRRVRPTSWQVSAPTDGAPRAHVADLRRMHGEVHPAAAGLRAAHDWSGPSFRSTSPLGATKVSVSSSPNITITESNQR